jgi:broad specificity phosphatase PhoE
VARWAAARAPAAILTSPATRCYRTVLPLSRELGLSIETSEGLGPGCPPDSISVMEALKPSGDPVVVCTHGEVIEYLQHHMGGAKRAGFGADRPREKGSIWVLQLANQTVIFAQYVPPTTAR